LPGKLANFGRLLALPHPQTTQAALSTTSTARIPARIGAFRAYPQGIPQCPRNLPRRHKTVAPATGIRLCL